MLLNLLLKMREEAGEMYTPFQNYITTVICIVKYLYIFLLANSLAI